MIGNRVILEKYNKISPNGAKVFLEEVNNFTYNVNCEERIISDNLKLIEFEFKTKDSFNFDFNESANSSLYFLFSFKNEFKISLDTNYAPNSISEYQSAVVFKEGSNNLNFNFKASKEYHFYMILIEEYISDNVEEAIFNQYKEILSDLGLKAPFLFIGLPNLKITQEINRLFLPSKDNTFYYKLIAAGYVNIILGLKLQQYLNSFKNAEKYNGSLNAREIAALTEVADLIKNNPEEEYCIESLRKESGLSVPKLQEGFKEMYNCTVGNFIREERLRKAEELMKSTDMNISEIVFSVGLNSRSYFSLIFKNKFSCSPRQYLKKLKSNVAVKMFPINKKPPKQINK